MKKILLFLTIISAISTQSQAILVKDIEAGNLSSMPTYALNRVDYNGKLIFSAKNNATGNYSTWATDGSNSGTEILYENGGGTAFAPSHFMYSAAYNKVFFSASFSNVTPRLWSTDGIAANTQYADNFSSAPKYITEFNNTIYFQGYIAAQYGHELVFFDNSTSTTYTISYNFKSNGDSYPEELKTIGNNLYFSAIGNFNQGRELFISDGTTVGTKILKDINSGTGDSNPKNFTSFNNKVYFSADDGINGRELWVTDGTEVNTNMVADLNSGSGFSLDPNEPTIFTEYKNELYFTAYTTDTGKELFKVNASGTIINVADINPGATNNSNPKDFFVFDDKLFFSADNGTDGYELWYTENTGSSTSKTAAITTTLFKDLNASGDSNPTNFIAFDSKMYFTADNGINGKELWESDGSVSGTKLKQDINPNGDSNPRDFIISNNLLYFSANDGTNGDELWKYSNNFIIGSLSPNDNATDLYISGENLKITLNKEIVKGTGSIIIYKSIDDSVFESINVSSSNVTINNNTAVISPTLDFLASEDYYVLIDNGALKDTSNNVFTGISDKTIWNFATTSKQNQTISFNTLPNKTFGDADFQLTATANSNLEITYTSSNTNIATITAATASSPALVNILNAGTTTITANQAGDSNFNPAANVSQSFTVDKADQIINFGALANKSFGDADFQLNATSDSNLAVSYTSSNTNVASVSGNTVTIIGAGTTTITANQVGNSNYNSAPDVTQTIIIDKADQTITFNTLSSKTFGDSDFQLNATSSSNLTISYTSSNTNVATINGNIVTIIGSGLTTITSSQAGNANYNSATGVTQNLIVDKVDQTLTFNALSSKTFGDSDFQLTATSDSNLAVSYTSSNTNVATISGNTVTIIGAGTTTITANQVGNSNYNPATDVTQNLSINKATRVVTIDPIPTKTFGDPNFFITSSVVGGVPATNRTFYYFANSSTSNVATLNVNTGEVGIIGTGTVNFSIEYRVEANYTRTDIAGSFTVNKADQTITFNPIATVGVNDANFNLAATSNTSLPISYVSSNPSVASINGNAIDILAVGSTTITANQIGNNNYNDAQSVSQTLTVSNTASIDDFNNLDFEIFPNPVSSSFEIKSNIKIVKVEVYNLLAQKVKQFINPKNNKFSVDELNSGVYLIKIHTEKGVVTSKILKIF